MLRRAAFFVVPALLALACSSSSDEASKPKPTPLPALTPDQVKTTIDLTVVPKTPRQSYKDGPNPASPDALQSYLDRGFGDETTGPGLSYVTRVIDDSTPPARGPNAKRLLRFVHLTDLQLADDESPNRLGLYDAATVTASALRPQDPDLCRMTNAAVRTINGLHAKDPIAFVLLGGDNSDSAQTNEIDWFLGMLDGADSVECDSGKDDDLIPGPDNDGKDPFVAPGLAMPWKWNTGNHDVLVQGNLKIDANNMATAIGDTSNGGTRDYTQGGLVANGDFVVPDPRRALLSRTDLMAKIAGDKDGHGLGDVQKQSGRGTYTFDAEGTPFRFLVMDTAHEAGGADGVITQREVDRILKPSLDQAKADGKYVILASHHAVGSLTTDGGAFGSEEADALTSEQWTDLVGGYDNVVFSVVGHTHLNQVKAIKPKSGHAWWEVMTSAIADFPHEVRTVEIFDQDNGWLMLRATDVDLALDGDPVAADGRRKGIVDLASGWLEMDGSGTPDNRDVEIWIKKP